MIRVPRTISFKNKEISPLSPELPGAALAHVRTGPRGAPVLVSGGRETPAVRGSRDALPRSAQTRRTHRGPQISTKTRKRTPGHEKPLQVTAPSVSGQRFPTMAELGAASPLPLPHTAGCCRSVSPIHDLSGSGTAARARPQPGDGHDGRPGARPD